MIRSGDFLDRIVTKLSGLDKDTWGEITILLPGRRAGRKLQEALIQEAGPGKWLPHISTLGEWSAEQLGLTVPNKMELLVELQHVAEGMRLHHTLPEWGSFDRFQPWGMAALADFNAVDHHLLEARQVFRDLRNIKDIEAWSFGRPDLTAGQQAFLAQWNTLHPLHTAFHAHLEDHGSCTSGMLARKMATEEGALRQVSGPVWMAGANALTPAEHKTVDRLVQSGWGEWIWDTDRSYVQEGLEAGRFVREIVSKQRQSELPHPMADVTGSANDKVRDWNLVTCSSRTMQTQYVRQHLESIGKKDLDRVAVILPSADLAPLVLASIPSSVEKVNLTMGVPLDRTPLRSFLHLLFGLHGDNGRLHHSRVRGLLAHPLTRALHPEAAEQLGPLTRRCTQQTLIRLTRQDLKDFPKVEAVLEPWWAGQQAAAEDRDDGTTAVLSRAARWTGDNPKSLPKDPWLSATWMGFRDVVALHERSIEKTGTPPNLAETRNRVQRWMAQHAVDLAGEPLEGLQVMGLLESRGSTSTKSLCSMSTKAHSQMERLHHLLCPWISNAPLAFPAGPSATESSPHTCTACCTDPARFTCSVLVPTWETAGRSPVGSWVNSKPGPNLRFRAWRSTSRSGLHRCLTPHHPYLLWVGVPRPANPSTPCSPTASAHRH